MSDCFAVYVRRLSQWVALKRGRSGYIASGEKFTWELIALMNEPDGQTVHTEPWIKVFEAIFGSRVTGSGSNRR